MAKGYVILNEVIRDSKGMGRYARAAAPSMAESGAKVLVADPQHEVLEGDWPAHQTVVLEFESVEAARAWYHSESYQQAAKLRHAAADTNAVILAGFEASRG